MAVILWLIIALLAGIIEAVTTTLVSVWLALGAVCAAACAGFGLSTTLQCIVFAAVSLVLLILTAPLGARFRETSKTATNADRLIGKIGIVTEEVDALEGTGEVKVAGQRWSVQVRGGEKLSVGTQVEVLEIVGAHLVVKAL